MGEETKTGLGLFSPAALLEGRDEPREPIESRKVLEKREVYVFTDLPVEGGEFKVEALLSRCSVKGRRIGYCVEIGFPIYIAFEKKFEKDDEIVARSFYSGMLRKLETGKRRVSLTSEGLVAIVFEE